jgi:hypothetical protein
MALNIDTLEHEHEILTIAPHYSGPGGEAEQARFWERVTADPQTVVVAASTCGDVIRVFSCHENALAFARAQDLPMMITPMVVDEPGWGRRCDA